MMSMRVGLRGLWVAVWAPAMAAIGLVAGEELPSGRQSGAVVGGLPLGVPFQPLVRVRHAGVEYTAPGRIMDASHPGQRIEMAVYETTDQPSAWQVKMRHLVIEPSQEGLAVVEMLAIENPTDRAYTGAPNPHGKKETFTLPLPAGAAHVQIVGGFDSCCTRVEDGRLITGTSILPGTSQYQFGYIVPARDGSAELTVSSPAPTARLWVFVPSDGTTVAAEGLEKSDMKMGDGKTRFYKAADVPVVKLTVGGLQSLPSMQTKDGHAAAAAAAPPKTSHLPQIIAGVGGGMVLLFGLTMLLVRSPKAAVKRG